MKQEEFKKLVIKARGFFNKNNPGEKTPHLNKILRILNLENPDFSQIKTILDHTVLGKGEVSSLKNALSKLQDAQKVA